MLPRTPEPELMDDAEQAEAYATADFAEVNQGFVDRLLALAPELTAPASVVDLGCGPGDIAVRLCRARPGLQVTAVDGAAAMLAHARQAIDAAGLGDCVQLVLATLPGAPLPEHGFDAVISNSLLHHLTDPAVLWREIVRLGRPGAPVLVVDLTRPATGDEVAALVAEHAAEAPAILRRDFENSLVAAFTPDEVRAQLGACHLDRHLAVEIISDRHLAVFGRLPRLP
jgi:ubiquinone/menaquinone biosynthesis C-methylase UbiE